jgi:hypothetical protein
MRSELADFPRVREVWGAGRLFLARAVGAAAISVLVCLVSGCISELDVGRFRTVGIDIVSRFFHRASLLPDGRVLVTGGSGIDIQGPSLVTLDDISIFDPKTQRFERLRMGDGTTFRLLTARSAHTQTTLPDGRVLLTGGRAGAAGTNPGQAIDAVEILDPTSSQATRGPPMSEPRAEHTATLLSDGRVVVAGAGSWQVFSPSNDEWSAAIPMQRTRIAHAAVLIEGGDGESERVLVIGGGGSGPDTLELLDPSAGSRLMESRLPQGVDDVAADRLPDGRVLIVGGQTASGDTINTAYLYDIATDRLVAAPPLPERPDGISDHQLVVVSPYAIVFGGEQQKAGQDVELDYVAVFDPRVDQWNTHGRMRFAHDDFPAVRFSGGSILLVGGGVGVLGHEVPSASAEVFTLTPDEWSFELDGSKSRGGTVRLMPPKDN